MGTSMRGWRRAVLLATATAAITATAATAQAAVKEPTGPVQPDILTAALYATTNPTIAPPGANDWNCKPSPQHPNPVLLSNGTTANAYENWANLSQQLKDAGYCVFAGNFGHTPGSFVQTIGTIPETAKQIAAFGDKILAATGARKLDVVGHSQGGMSPRYWIKYLGGANKIGRLIGLAPSNHGTSFYGLLDTVQKIPGVGDVMAQGCAACTEQATGSPFLTDLNAGGDTVAGVDYTVIETKYDDVVTPYTNAFLEGAKNVLLQDVCALDFTDHLGITYDPIAERLVLNALDPASARTPLCLPVPPVIS